MSDVHTASMLLLLPSIDVARLPIRKSNEKEMKK
jgi:hypothetical protein